MTVGGNDGLFGQDDTRGDPPPVTPGPARVRPEAATGPPRPPQLRARPRIVDEPGILGLSRHSRGRFGSRLFTLFFVLVFMLIVVDMVAALLDY